MKHEDLVTNANKALDALYGDISVSKETTLEDLEIIIEDLQVRCESLRQTNELPKD